MPTDKYVLRISKPNLGKNVEDCTDDELVFNSEKEVLKVPLNGIGTANSETTVAHGLGYIPIFLTCRRFTVSGEDRAKPFGADNGVSCNSTQLDFSNGLYGNYKYYFFYHSGA